MEYGKKDWLGMPRVSEWSGVGRMVVKLIFGSILGIYFLALTSATWAQGLPRIEAKSDCFVTAPEGSEFGFQSDCGYVVVPQSRGGGAEGEIQLPYMRIQAATPTSEPPLFMLAGGPGGTIIKSITLALLEPEILGPVLDTRDIVLLDQRGTFNSRPYLDCPGYDALPFATLRDGLDADGINAMARGALAACLTRHQAAGVDLAAYNNVENAADVNDVRVALGYRQIAFYGGSYGALLGQHVMRDFPEILELVVFDSTDALSVQSWLCCTNRPEVTLPLTPDGFSLRLRYWVCREQ